MSDAATRTIAVLALVGGWLLAVGTSLLRGRRKRLSPADGGTPSQPAPLSDVDHDRRT